MKVLLIIDQVILGSIFTGLLLWTITRYIKDRIDENYCTNKRRLSHK